MDCRRIESLLPPYVDGEARPQEIGEVERHLIDCPSCRSAVAAQRTARLVLQARGRDIAPALPPGLRTRLAATLRPQINPSLGWRGRLSAFAAAAALLVVIVGALELLSPRSNVLYAAQLAIDHVRCFVAERASTGTADPAALEREYRDHWGWTIDVPPSNQEMGLRLIAARRCPFWVGKHAHVLYRLGDREVSLYIDKNDVRANGQLHVLGHTENIWQSNGNSYAVIARGVPEAELTKIISFLQRASGR